MSCSKPVRWLGSLSFVTLLAWSAGCGSSDDEGTGGSAGGQDAGADAASQDATTDTSNEAAAEAGPDAMAEASPETGPEAGPDATEPMTTATIETSLGTIVVALEREAAPITVDNFQKYADAEYYDGLIFHRVISGFMIQGGGFEPGMQPRATLHPPIENEGASSGLSNVRGTIAMARTSLPDSATSQFFINTVDNLYLDPGNGEAGYAVFGRVIEGMDVVEAIEAVDTHSVGSYEDVPVDDVVINSIVVTDP